MPCNTIIDTATGETVGILCTGGPVYKTLYKGREYLFELHSYLGPMPVTKKDHEPRSTIPAGFWGMWEIFEKLSDNDKAAFAVD